MKNKKQTAKTTLVDKLLGKKGPVVLTTAELRQLRKAFEDIGQTNLRLTGMVRGMAAALYRKRLQVVHYEHADGSVSFDLQPAPPDDEPVSVN